MRTRPSFAYDPIGPLRSPLSRRSIPEATADMASVIVLVAQNAADGTVTKDDLHRAGFSNGEIDACHAEAVRLAAARLRPRQTDARHVEPREAA